MMGLAKLLKDVLIQQHVTIIQTLNVMMDHVIIPMVVQMLELVIMILARHVTTVHVLTL